MYVELNGTWGVQPSRNLNRVIRDGLLKNSCTCIFEVPVSIVPTSVVQIDFHPSRLLPWERMHKIPDWLGDTCVGVQVINERLHIFDAPSMNDTGIRHPIQQRTTQVIILRAAGSEPVVNNGHTIRNADLAVL